MLNLRHAVRLSHLSILLRVGVVAACIVAVFYGFVCLGDILNVRVSADPNSPVASSLERWIGDLHTDGWAAFRIFLQAMTAMIALLVLDLAVVEMSRGRFFAKGNVAKLEIVTFCLFSLEVIPWALSFISDHYTRPDLNPTKWGAIALLVILVVVYRQAAKFVGRQEQAV